MNGKQINYCKIGLLFKNDDLDYQKLYTGKILKASIMPTSSDVFKSSYTVSHLTNVWQQQTWRYKSLHVST